jgi:hypothetical protein
MPIFTKPATLKINEKPRKYHFSFSQSTFTPRNNSTGSLRFLVPEPIRSGILVFSAANTSALMIPLPGD